MGHNKNTVINQERANEQYTAHVTHDVSNFDFEENKMKLCFLIVLWPSIDVVENDKSILIT